jgi:hypothetical protein
VAVKLPPDALRVLAPDAAGTPIDPTEGDPNDG